MPKLDTDKLVTIGNAAKLADVTRLWMRTLVQSGRIEGVCIDGQWFADRESAGAYKRTEGVGRPRNSISRKCPVGNIPKKSRGKRGS